MSNAGREQPRNASAKLVFHRVGNSYFLAEVWRSSTAEGMILPASKQEKDLAKELQACPGTLGRLRRSRHRSELTPPSPNWRPEPHRSGFFASGSMEHGMSLSVQSRINGAALAL